MTELHTVTAPGHYRLVMLRHARAEEHATGGDAQRSLTLEGRGQATCIGRALRAAGRRPDLVLCSTALRTRQTWSLAAMTWTERAPEVRQVEALFGGGVADVIGCVHDVPASVRTLMVVAHEPAVSATAAALAGLGSDNGALYRARAGVGVGTWCLLESDAPWEAWGCASARLVEVMAPN